MPFVFLAAAGLAGALLAPPAGAAEPAAPHRVPDTMAQRVLACTPCHGREGRATRDGYFPRIAGKPAGYLHEQLRHFREGRRRNATMAALTAPLSDAYLGEIAAHFASLDLPYPPAQAADAPAAVLARGEQLVRRGDGRERPSCAACHGEKLTGLAPAIPGLLGLPRDYLVGQLGAWQNGQRSARRPDCMHGIAAKLNADDVAALATWLAAQPVPADSRPATALPAPLPLECGSVPR
jgi:cytochrome c553